MSRRQKIVCAVVATIAALIIGFQIWGPEANDCDGPCNAWVDFASALATFALVVALILGGVGYGVWSLIRARRRR